MQSYNIPQIVLLRDYFKHQNVTNKKSFYN